MSLWSNTDANTSAPKFKVAGGLGIANTGGDLYANATADVFKTGLTVGLFAVSSDELQGTGNVGSITITAAGDSFTARPTIVITGANTSAATATANAGVVLATVAAGQGGSNWNIGDLLYFGSGTSSVNCALTVANTGASNAVTAVTLTRAGNYTTIFTPVVLAAPTYNTSAAGAATVGVNFKANLSFGIVSVDVTANGNAYNKSTIGATIGGAGGANAAVGFVLTGQEGPKAAGTGWVLRTEGRGGRAGRVQYETIVAMGSMGAGANDNVQFAP